MFARRRRRAARRPRRWPGVAHWTDLTWVVRGVRHAGARGRAIEERDGAGAQTVMVGNEAFVERFFPGRNPVGRTLTMTLEVPDGEFTFDPKAIVGIVGNAVHESIREPIRPIVYLPMAQEPLQSLFVAGAFIAVSSEAASPERLSRSLAAALESVDPDVRVSFLTGTGVVDFALARDHQVARLATFGGLLALLLTALGLGGVTAYQVTRLRPELAVRVALGSTRSRLVGLVLSRVLRRVAGGGVSLGFALWTSRMAESMLFGVEPRDPRSSSAAPPSRSRSSVCSPAGYRRIGHPGSTRRAR